MIPITVSVYLKKNGENKIMKILVTGFDPFGGEKVNPAYEAVKLLPDTIHGAEIIKLEIPTVFSKCGPSVEEGIRQHQPDVVLNVGQAGGRASITIEKVAINFADARIPDNQGEQPVDELLQSDGENAYFASLPVKAMMQNVREHGLPCSISYTAGTYVCNAVMYKTAFFSMGLASIPIIGYTRDILPELRGKRQDEISQYPRRFYSRTIRQRPGN